MPKSVKIASVVVVALLLVVVVVMLYQQSPTPTATQPAIKPATPAKPAPRPTSLDMTPERVPGTDSVDPTKPTPAPRSPSAPLAVQANEPPMVTPSTPSPAPAPTTQQKPPPAPIPVATSAPATMPAEPPTVTATPELPMRVPIVSKPTTMPLIAEPDSPRTYTVKSGDTLTSIAQKTLGSESRWHEIAEANPLIDPIKLRIGQVLKMPVPPGPTGAPVAGGAGAETKPSTQPRDSSGRIIYIVRPLDSLASISKQYYGTRDYWKTIYSANRSVIGSNPDKLEPGTRLVIPPAPQPAH